MEKKICCTCHEEKFLTDFGLHSRSPDGRKSRCKDCRSKHEKPNKERKSHWYKKDKLDNPFKYKIKAKIQNNKRKVYKSLWHKKKYIPKIKKSESDLDLKIKRMCRNVLHNCLRKTDNTKNGRTFEALGYTHEQLRSHLENLWLEGMNWANYGEWQIDHIIPIHKFPKDTPLYIINSLPNLRPLWKTSRTINGVDYVGNLNRPHNEKIEFRRTNNCTLFIDIDGTLVRHYMDENYFTAKDQVFRAMDILDGVAAKFAEWKAANHYIVLTTARKEEDRKVTEKHLKDIGLYWDQLVMGLESGERILINDLKPYAPYRPMAIGINIVRNDGLKDVDLELAVKLQTLALYYNVQLTTNIK